MLGFSAISETAISEAADAGPPEAIVSAASPLGAVLLLGASSLAWASDASPLRQPSVVACLQVNAYASAPAVLGTPVVRSLNAAAMAAAAGPLGAVRAVGSIPLASFAAAASPLGTPYALAYHDFTGQLGDAITRYVLDLTTPGGLVRVPISSWQATLRTGASCYVQCVVPACMDWTDQINTADEFVISRVADAPTGEITYEMARSQLEQVSMARGPTNYTATLSGYSDAFAADEDPDTTFDRTLTGIRSITTGTSPTRVRSAIDWLLRPGQRAYYADGASFVVVFINYYVPTGNDAYMDVGE